MSALYFRHKQFGHIVRADGPQPKGTDAFAGTVVACDDDEAIAVGTHSSCWMRAAFERTTRIDPPIPADTIESMQSELETLRIALGVDAEPLDTLPDRMLRAAQCYRRLYLKVKEWENE